MDISNYSENQIKNKVFDIAQEVIKLLIKKGGGHFGGSLSMIDVLTVLYYKILNINPNEPNDVNRDRFILSKGHACLPLYAILADLGFFPKRLFYHFEEFGNPLTMHPNMLKIPGIDFSTGSMGHGLSIGVGFALAGKLDRKKYKTFVLMGDGEQHEGTIWEAAMTAAHYKLDNLVGIIDRNMFCVDGLVDEVINIEPLSKKWESFGWNVRIINGHDVGEIIETFKKIPFEVNKPSIIIAKTIKGKRISFYENKRESHRIDISKSQGIAALRELKNLKERLEKNAKGK